MLPPHGVWVTEASGNDEQRLPGSVGNCSPHNSAMDMQYKQIRQPGSQAEPLRSSGIALDTGQRQSLIKAAGQH